MLSWFVAACALVSFVIGIVAAFSIKSDIQVIVAVLGLGFAAIFLTLEAILRRLPKDPLR